jgi:hypothetical protein
MLLQKTGMFLRECELHERGALSARAYTNRTTTMWVKGQSGNPGGRPKNDIADLSREARRFGKTALATLVKICRKGEERNRLAAAVHLLDRGFGKPVQQIDAVVMAKKLTELSLSELQALEARLLSLPEPDERAETIQ